MPASSSASPAESFLERNKGQLLSAALFLLVTYSVVRNTFKAFLKPFWFDELCTWIVAHQPNASTLWRALSRAADGQPPPYYFLETFFSSIIRNDQVAFRMPSILAFCLMAICLFLWLKKRHSIPIAFATCLLPFLTALYTLYAVEARPYCVVSACLSLALLAYQRVPSPWWVLLFGASLLAAQAFHFYSVFMMSPFFVAEGFFFVKTKSFRWPVWLAMFLAITPLFLFWRELSAIKTYYSAHYWTHPTLLGTLKTYGWILGITQGLAGSSAAVLLSAVLSAAIIGVAMFLFWRAVRARPADSPHFHEDALIAAFLILPLTVFLVVKLTNGGLTARYLLPTIIGLVLIFARILSRLSSRPLLFVSLLLCVGIAMQETAFWTSFYEEYQLGFARPHPVERLAESAGHQDLAVVIADGHDYLEVQHYASTAWKQRFIYLSAPDAAVAFGRPDTNERELLVLRDFAPLQVFEYGQYARSHSEFLVFSKPSLENNPDWFISWLWKDGWVLEQVAREGESSVFLASRPKRSLTSEAGSPP